MKNLALSLLFFFVAPAFLAQAQAGEFYPMNPAPRLVAARDDATCFVQNDDVTCMGKDLARYTGTSHGYQHIRQISVGNQFFCLLDDFGVSCKGDEEDILNVPPLSHPSQISAGRNHACALDETGVVCWGANAYSESTVPLLSHPREVQAGENYSCALDDTGAVCWGDGQYSQLEVKKDLHHPHDLVLGHSHACVIVDEGVSCWGSNAWRQNNPMPQFSHPHKLFAGHFSTCALDDHGLQCWGSDADGKSPSVPEVVVKSSTQIALGFSHFCSISEKGLFCWGDNRRAQISVPRPLISPFRLFAGASETCAIDQNFLRCWGEFSKDWDLAQLGSEPIDQVVLNNEYACVVQASAVQCSGYKPKENFQKISWLKGSEQIVASNSEFCAVFQNRASCGQGKYEDPFLGVTLFNQKVTALRASKHRICALESNQIECWRTDRGYTTHFRHQLHHVRNWVAGDDYVCVLDDLGFRCTTGLSYPGSSRALPQLENPTQLAGGADFVCALENESVKCGGNSLSGATEVPKDLKHPRQVVTGIYHACALDDEGVKCWGRNFEGQAGFPAIWEH